MDRRTPVKQYVPDLSMQGHKKSIFKKIIPSFPCMVVAFAEDNASMSSIGYFEKLCIIFYAKPKEVDLN